MRPDCCCYKTDPVECFSGGILMGFSLGSEKALEVSILEGLVNTTMLV